MSEGLSKEAADLLRELADDFANHRIGWDYPNTKNAARAYLASLEKLAEERCPCCKGPRAEAWLCNNHEFHNLPKPRSADDALAELQTFLAELFPDGTISPSTRKWMMERVKEARGK